MRRRGPCQSKCRTALGDGRRSLQSLSLIIWRFFSVSIAESLSVFSPAPSRLVFRAGRSRPCTALLYRVDHYSSDDIECAYFEIERDVVRLFTFFLRVKSAARGTIYCVAIVCGQFITRCPCFDTALIDPHLGADQFFSFTSFNTLTVYYVKMLTCRIAQCPRFVRPCTHAYCPAVVFCQARFTFDEGRPGVKMTER